MTLSEVEKPKAGYYKWKRTKRKDWVCKATHSTNDFGLRSAYYAGYEDALRVHDIVYGEDKTRLLKEVFGSVARS